MAQSLAVLKAALQLILAAQLHFCPALKLTCVLCGMLAH